MHFNLQMRVRTTGNDHQSDKINVVFIKLLYKGITQI